MRRREVVAPDGTRWSVGRRWLPRRWRGPRWRRTGDGIDLIPIDLAEGGLTGALIGLAIAVGVVLFVVFLAPLLVLLVEILIAVVLVAGVVLGRVLLRRPWIVEARPANRATKAAFTWRVVGWRESGRVIEEVSGALASGADPRPVGVEAVASLG